MDIQKQQLSALIGALTQLRLQADKTLAPRYPEFAGHPYPIGRCKEIRDQVFSSLKVSNTYLNYPILNLLKASNQKYPSLIKVWGALRNQYFQNAMILDQWYIDVANDTVDPNKPKVEISQLSFAEFKPITSFEQFAQIAQPYWQVELFRNDICPALAPYLPIICVAKNQISWLSAANNDMLNVATQSHFRASERILKTLPNLPIAIANKWWNITNRYSNVPQLTSQGQPEQYCLQYREEEKHLSASFRDKIILAYHMLPKGI